ncbi:hypothetical protein D3C71_1952930 [compost metagenome]
MGIPEDEANRYNDYIKEGNILVLVNSSADRDPYAYDTFRTNNSLNYTDPRVEDNVYRH